MGLWLERLEHRNSDAPLQVDHGFTELTSKTNHGHWLSKPELERLLQRFLDARR